MIKLQVPNNPRELRAAAEFFAGLCNCLVEPRPVRDEVNPIPSKPVPYTIVADSVRLDGNTLVTPELPINQCGKDPGSTFEQATRTPDPQAGKTGVVPHYRTGADPVPNLDGQTHGGLPVFNTAGPIPPPIPLQPTEVVVDKSGIPWDERIHSAGKTMLASGLFRMKKCPGSMTKDAWELYIEEVKTDLKKLMGVPTPAPPPEGAIITLSALTEAILKAKKTPIDVQAVCSSVGLNGFPELGARPDLIPEVAAALGL